MRWWFDWSKLSISLSHAIESNFLHNFLNMRRLMAAVAWPIILVLYTLLVLSASAVVVLAKKNSHNDNDVRLKVDIRKETLVGAPSCQHTFTQIELLNLVSCRSAIIITK